MKGKAKEAFIEYYYSNKIDLAIGIISDGTSKRFQRFLELPLSMQYGVLVDFFDSVGVNIDVWFEGGKFFLDINDQSYSLSETRNEARTKAIEKAVEIFNSK